MILLIDNYDSFSYNLVHYLAELGAEVKVYRNDQVGLAEIAEMKPSHIVISPGPGTPDQAGICLDLVSRYGSYIPVLGVCLGHQVIGQAYGGKVVRAPVLMHGKTSQIRHDGSHIFKNVPSPFTATRYHSLILAEENLPDCLEVAARAETGEIMAVRHRQHPVQGVQFHPESILTQHGKTILRNFLNQ
ncbi:MAG: aminodeoxychorismate/anthranilate synthase component II [Peptococcaceae bacterium]|nr:aminodeoxychorismate/anthranilate synthase component II [Peptococcaceae bacterium]